MTGQPSLDLRLSQRSEAHLHEKGSIQNQAEWINCDSSGKSGKGGRVRGLGMEGVDVCVWEGGQHWPCTACTVHCQVPVNTANLVPPPLSSFSLFRVVWSPHLVTIGLNLTHMRFAAVCQPDFLTSR